MKLAVVAPIGYLDRYCRTGCQLCYADLILENELYRNFYVERVRAGDLVILDGSPIIPRKPHMEILLEAAKLLKPTLVVCPDVEFDYGKTVLLAKEFTKRYKGDTIGCLQGADINLLNMCYRELVSICKVMGLPMSNEKIAKRSRIIELLGIKGPSFYLEVYSNPLEELPVHRSVIGIGTSFPVRLGIDLRTLNQPRPEPPILNFHCEIQIPELVEMNIKVYKEKLDEATKL